MFLGQFDQEWPGPAVNILKVLFEDCATVFLEPIPEDSCEFFFSLLLSQLDLGITLEGIRLGDQADDHRAAITLDDRLDLLLETIGCDRAGARDYAAFLGFFFLEPS